MKQTATDNNFGHEALKFAKQVLTTYFVETNPEKVLHYFSSHCSSWVGWAEHEIYTNYNDIFNTFTSRIDEIRKHFLSDMQAEVLFAKNNLCVVFIACRIQAELQTGIHLDEPSRFTFVIRREDDALKIVHLHSSTAWAGLNTNEVFPIAKGGAKFYEHELQLEKSSIVSFVSACTPNGLKCCRAEKGYPAVYINKALYAMAGYESMTEMLIATNGDIKNMIYSSDLPKVKSIMAAHCGNVPYTVNYRLLRKDGTVLWVLERGQFVPYEGKDDYFVCSIAPLFPEQNEFNYGGLLEYNEIENAQIPMDLYLKMALKIIEKNDTKTAIFQLLKLCCSMAQISGAFIKDIRNTNENMPVIAKYFINNDSFVSTLKCTPADIINRFNSHGISQCNDTELLPKEYRLKLDELNVKAYLSKIIATSSKTDYVLTFLSLGTPHNWTEAEKDLITQTARLVSLLFKTSAQDKN